MDRAKDQALSPIDDIPEARRDGQFSGGESSADLSWRLGVVGAIALLVGGMVAATQGSRFISRQPQPLIGLVEASQSTAVADPPTQALTSTISQRLVPTQRTLLGHKSYDEAPLDELMAVTADGRVRLRRPAAEKFLAMVAEARRQGILLVPLSGFRTLADQEYLFFGIKAQRAQMAAQRAEVSAPPGYSEHHTGYAIDIGDADYPDTHLQTEFSDTPAFQWLEANATRYGFELSFHPGNEQGVAFEPWHWRFVGNRDSLETFYRE